jgi:transposase
MRYELTDDEWTAIEPMLPNKPRGVPRVNDRRVPRGRSQCRRGRSLALVHVAAITDWRTVKCCVVGRERCRAEMIVQACTCMCCQPEAA